MSEHKKCRFCGLEGREFSYDRRGYVECNSATSSTRCLSVMAATTEKAWEQWDEINTVPILKLKATVRDVLLSECDIISPVTEWLHKHRGEEVEIQENHSLCCETYQYHLSNSPQYFLRSAWLDNIHGETRELTVDEWKNLPRGTPVEISLNNEVWYTSYWEKYNESNKEDKYMVSHVHYATGTYAELSSWSYCRLLGGIIFV